MARAFVSNLFSKYEEPEFEVLEKKDDYEVRLYTPGTWVVTENSSEGDQSNLMFRRLFKYISGENEPGTKISMTIPVAQLVDGADPERNRMKTMAFFVPKELHGKAPLPTAEHVSLKEEVSATQDGKLKYAVRYFSGYPNRAGWKKEEETLEEALKRDGVARSSENTFFCTYNAPFVLINRRNEVWVPVQ